MKTRKHLVRDFPKLDDRARIKHIENNRNDLVEKKNEKDKKSELVNRSCIDYLPDD